MLTRSSFSLALLALFALCPSAIAQTSHRSYTTLSGFFDYQTNNTCQYIRVNPANGNIHVILMTAQDSLDFLSSRRTVYAFSSNGGLSWTNFNNVTIPARRSGYPSLDLLRGPVAGLPIIVNHSAGPFGTESIAYVASPENSGAFAELIPPPPISGTTGQPLWPDVAGLADGSFALVAQAPTQFGCNLYVTIHDFTAYSPWHGLTNYDCTIRYVVEANDSGRVGILYTGTDGLRFSESHVGSLTWRDTLIIPYPIVIGPDTFTLWGSIDFVYRNNEPLVVMALQHVNRPQTNDGAVIGFWSRATGVRIVVPRSAVFGIVDTLNRRQVRHLSMGYPVIGLSGENPVVGFQAFMAETSAAGFNYSDVFWTLSIDRQTWLAPWNLTQTPTLDERYPSVSRWNQSGPGTAVINMVWQEDTEPGSHAFSDGAPLARSKQMFARSVFFWLDVDEKATHPTEFWLGQNYPNPFNPITTIRFRIQRSGFVSLKVYDMLGREVATLVDGVQGLGFKAVELDGSNLPSGVYFCQLRAGSFVQTRKMLLLR